MKRIKGENLIKEELQKVTHLEVMQAFEMLLNYVNDKNELPESIFQEVFSKLSDDEKELLTGMLISKGIKVLPLSAENIKQAEIETVEQKREQELERLKSEILNALNEDGEITEMKLEKILEGVEDVVLKARIFEWLAETPLIERIKVKKKAFFELGEIRTVPNKDYKKKIKKRIKMITGDFIWHK